MIRATTFKGKRVAVFGLGASGNATALSLLAGGADVAAWDDSDASRAAAGALGIPIVDLSAADWSRFSSLVLAPGVPLTHPEPHWTVSRAQAAGVEIIGDVEIFFRERAATAPSSPVIAITGTNGKSTTTALTAHILRHAGLKVEMGGNIGKAVLTLAEPAEDTFCVLELSSFQIDLTPSLKPTIGVLLNVTPDHIDRHGTIETYAAVKERLVAAADIACVGVDDEVSTAIVKRRVAAGPAVAFSVAKPIRPGYCLYDGWLICADATGLAVRLATTAGIATLRGAHNAQNALAAIASVRELLRARGHGADVDWQAALGSYGGLAHRMEDIGRVGRVVFINDSKATNADSTEKALSAWQRGIHWIAGGKPKEGGITALAAYFPRVAKVYLIGAAADEFAATLAGKVAYEQCGTLDVAVAAAARDAGQSAEKEPVVLLSPACASYDQFKNFEVRGEAFRTLVTALPGFKPRTGAS